MNSILCTLLLFIILMGHACRCGTTFDNRTALARHHNTCQVVREADASRRARLGAETTNGRHKNKKKRKGVEGSSQASKRAAEDLNGSPSFRDNTSPERARPLSPDPMPPSPSPPPMQTQSGRPRRNYRLPARFQDILPEKSAPIPSVQLPIEPEPLSPIQRVRLVVRDTMRTTLNRFGVLREYPHRPSYDPDAAVRPEDLSNVPHVAESTVSDTATAELPPPPYPFRNMSIFRLMSWMNSGSNNKSEAEVTRLVKDVISAEDFRVEDLADFNAHRESVRLDASASDEAALPFMKDGWQQLSVNIDVPTSDKNRPSRKFAVPGLHRRSLTDVIKSAFAGSTAHLFHHTPFKRVHVSPTTGVETRIYDEVYTSDAWLKAHDDLQKQPNEPNCLLEKIIAGLMFWSDSTHLANFGTAKLWPVYLYFANLSKYERAKPNSGAAHHVAYLPSIPDYIDDHQEKPSALIVA